MFYRWLNKFLPQKLSAVIVVLAYSLMLLAIIFTAEVEFAKFRYLGI